MKTQNRRKKRHDCFGNLEEFHNGEGKENLQDILHNWKQLTLNNELGKTGYTKWYAPGKRK